MIVREEESAVYIFTSASNQLRAIRLTLRSPHLRRWHSSANGRSHTASPSRRAPSSGLLVSERRSQMPPAALPSTRTSRTLPGFAGSRLLCPRMVIEELVLIHWDTGWRGSSSRNNNHKVAHLPSIRESQISSEVPVCLDASQTSAVSLTRDSLSSLMLVKCSIFE